MITKLPPVGFKILQISLQIMHHFLSRFCWPLLKVHFDGHAHVKLVLDIGMWVTQLGMWVTGYELSTRPGAATDGPKYSGEGVQLLGIMGSKSTMTLTYSHGSQTNSYPVMVQPTRVPRQSAHPGPWLV